jgi:hypothetical protein
VPVQKISPLQMEERRKKGLCYNCDSKWNPGHRCVAPKLFLLEHVEVGENEIFADSPASVPVDPMSDLIEFSDGEIVPEISLHAVTGSIHPKTMRVSGYLGNLKVVILIDSGSTHNFMDAALIHKLQLLINKASVVKVQVANGEVIVSEGKCDGVKVTVQEQSFTFDSYVIVLAGCDIVIGIQWLVTLGPIL